MGKKGFRPGTANDPRYPRLCETSRHVWRDWGLVAAGSLLLGSGCWRTAGAPVREQPDAAVPTITSRPHLGVTMPIRDAAAPSPPDAGADLRRTPVRSPGSPPHDRTRDGEAARGPDAGATDSEQRMMPERRIKGGLSIQHAAEMRTKTRKKAAKDR
jgi:hypothetical protein